MLFSKVLTLVLQRSLFLHHLLLTGVITPLQQLITIHLRIKYHLIYHHKFFYKPLVVFMVRKLNQRQHLLTTNCSLILICWILTNTLWKLTLELMNGFIVKSQFSQFKLTMMIQVLKVRILLRSLHKIIA